MWMGMDYTGRMRNYCLINTMYQDDCCITIFRGHATAIVVPKYLELCGTGRDVCWCSHRHRHWSSHLARENRVSHGVRQVGGPLQRSSSLRVPLLWNQRSHQEQLVTKVGKERILGAYVDDSMEPRARIRTMTYDTC